VDADLPAEHRQARRVPRRRSISRTRTKPPTDYEKPICWLPHGEVDNSSEGQVWVPNDKWGPVPRRDAAPVVRQVRVVQSPEGGRRRWIASGRGRPVPARL
jgi:hypothetical protein